MDLMTWKGSYAYVDSIFFMANPYWMILGIAMYMVFVLKLAPKFMEKRKPYNIRWLIFCYNLYQVIYCFAIVIYIPALGVRLKHTWLCDDNPRGTYDQIPDIQRRCFLFTLVLAVLRISEFLETFFSVLRKNKITILHCFHHTSVLIAIWMYAKYDLNRNAGLIILGNQITHALQYIHHMMGTFEATKKTARKLKKSITVTQIITLTFLLGHCLWMMFAGCSKSKFYPFLASAVALLIGLFVNQYIQGYPVREKQKSE